MSTHAFRAAFSRFGLIFSWFAIETSSAAV
uniref:Uncharacterized protein n=1 Tax=Anguilla anguilla TaxID=7936 RepID=A0A0E9PLS2_ANGAN